MNSLKADELSLYKLSTFKERLFYRFSIFSYKILNNLILKNIFDSLKFKNRDRILRQSSLEVLIPNKTRNRKASDLIAL